MLYIYFKISLVDICRRWYGWPCTPSVSENSRRRHAELKFQLIFRCASFVSASVCGVGGWKRKCSTYWKFYTFNDNNRANNGAHSVHKRNADPFDGIVEWFFSLLFRRKNDTVVLAQKGGEGGQGERGGAQPLLDIQTPRRAVAAAKKRALLRTENVKMPEWEESQEKRGD